MDIEELKRLHEITWFDELGRGRGSVMAESSIFAAFPAIVAKLEAAQRLRDAANESESLRAAVAAFDKEQQ